MLAQVVATSVGSLNLIGKAMAQVIKKRKQRTIFSQGTTNQYILKFFDINDNNNLRGYINDKGTTSCKQNKGVYIYENSKITFLENYKLKDFNFLFNDIYLKGGNSLYYKEDKLYANVLSASPDLGTYKNIYLKAVASSSKVFIPISMDKLVYKTKDLIRNFSHKDISFYMGEFSVIELPLFYGDIFSEIEAFYELFQLKANLISKGGDNMSKINKVFVLEGTELALKEAIKFLEQNNEVKDELR